MNLIIAAHWTDDEPNRAAKRVARKLHRHAIKDSGAVVSFTEAEIDPLLLNALRVLDLHETANYEVSR